MHPCCAIIGCSPKAFPWGWDEEDEYCAAMKLVLLNRITLFRSQGVVDFRVSMDCGAGLYAAEIINGLREAAGEVKLTCCVPCEEQPTKWAPELRNRYFNVLAGCTELVHVAPRKIVGCEFSAHLRAMAEAGTVIAVCDPDNPDCEREVAAVSVAKLLGKPVILLNPGAIG